MLASGTTTQTVQNVPYDGTGYKFIAVKLVKETGSVNCGTYVFPRQFCRQIGARVYLLKEITGWGGTYPVDIVENRVEINTNGVEIYIYGIK